MPPVAPATVARPPRHDGGGTPLRARQSQFRIRPTLELRLRESAKKGVISARFCSIWSPIQRATPWCRPMRNQSNAS